jgi:Fe-S oxidoreductase
VHCGLCLPVCPTYTTNALEADSPRGRIHLMKGLADGRIDLTAGVRRHLDLCLDCRACETACPSGVVYHELIEETRERLAEAIEALPATQRAVISLRDIEGWSSEEVRNALDLSETNQRVLLHRARSKVRAALESYLQEDGR